MILININLVSKKRRIMESFKKLFATVDMTEGRPWEKILIFTFPMLLGNIAQQLYNTVDSVVVGKYIGDNALAAVGSAGPIFNLLLVLFVGISTGAAIMVSQYFGARKRDELSITIGNSIVLTAIASVVIMIVATIAARPLLILLKTPDSILDWCTSYLRILLYILPFPRIRKNLQYIRHRPNFHHSRNALLRRYRLPFRFYRR